MTHIFFLYIQNTKSFFFLSFLTLHPLHPMQVMKQHVELMLSYEKYTIVCTYEFLHWLLCILYDRKIKIKEKRDIWVSTFWMKWKNPVGSLLALKPHQEMINFLMIKICYNSMQSPPAPTGKFEANRGFKTDRWSWKYMGEKKMDQVLSSKNSGRKRAKDKENSVVVMIGLACMRM